MGKSLVCYLKQPLFLDEHAFLQAPEIEMRLATGHEDAAVCRMEVYTEHWLIGGLNGRTRKEEKQTIVTPLNPTSELYVFMCIFNTP